MVKNFWNCGRVEGTASYRLAFKLKYLKNANKQWTKEVGIEDEMVINDMLNELNLLEQQEGVLG